MGLCAQTLEEGALEMREEHVSGSWVCMCVVAGVGPLGRGLGATLTTRQTLGRDSRDMF